ncbi:GSCFA domain-containing protein [Tabrizicola sp.]|uniref:GSCFA domain-containing protein n=1 Tax=Tabrizicola sp. TaxID=2005166 RepID=UPI002736BC13|nr:GSCFA domain-containing protein [Tabrizicola sp.]MDP3193940.1 GSCFA domain-containing protein [Tabrizicola sp.]
MSHPYETLPEDRFWRSAVADRDALEIAGLWKPKYPIQRRTRIVTAGSCFAQHFSKALVARRYRWLDFEPGPAGLMAEQRQDYHYGTFSFRTGNIYTPRMLLQWLTWALTDASPPAEAWEKDDRFYDPFRPGVEPGGFVSVEELLTSRAETLAAIAAAVRGAQVFVFTMGLTEAWQDTASGVEYAVCPGTVAGQFDPDRHGFVNHGFGALMGDMTAALRLMFRANRGLKVLLTVSPVPLTATASGQHVLTATNHSKSLLRAVASELVAAQTRVDYFPSYEIITHPVYKGRFFAPNLRSVLPAGVDHVMTQFFDDQAAAFGGETVAVLSALPHLTQVEEAPERELTEAEELRCEEEILATFAPDQRHG